MRNKRRVSETHGQTARELAACSSGTQHWVALWQRHALKAGGQAEESFALGLLGRLGGLEVCT